MENDINKKIEEIYNSFKLELQKVKDKKNKKIAELMEKAEEDYIEKIKKDIKL